MKKTSVFLCLVLSLYATEGIALSELSDNSNNSKIIKCNTINANGFAKNTCIQVSSKIMKYSEELIKNQTSYTNIKENFYPTKTYSNTPLHNNNVWNKIKNREKELAKLEPLGIKSTTFIEFSTPEYGNEQYIQIPNFYIKTLIGDKIQECYSVSNIQQINNDNLENYKVDCKKYLQ